MENATASPTSTTRASADRVHMFVDDVTVLDYAMLDSKRGVIGGSYMVDAEVTGKLDDEGVVFDFSLAKKSIKKIIDDLCDHRLVAPLHALESSKNGRSILKWTFGQEQHLSYDCPDQALCLLDVKTITPESIAQYLEKKILEAMPQNVLEIRLNLRLEEFEETQSTYHYTHGLKQHYGNCQRLLHGHQNKLDIFVDGEKRHDLEDQMAQEWRDIHFAFPENIPTENNLNMAQRQSHLDEVTISYEGNQGYFSVTLPGEMVYLMPYETTVENISRHLADRVSEKVSNPNSQIRVLAYEGIRKGAEVRL